MKNLSIKEILADSPLAKLPFVVERDLGRGHFSYMAYKTRTEAEKEAACDWSAKIHKVDW